jgi:hypothetical protein
LARLAQNPKIARVQRTLRWLEEDVPLLNQRVKDLSPERQKVAKRFAARMIDHTRAELERLMEEHAQQADGAEFPCEPAD